jgi:hypothetical protein
MKSFVETFIYEEKLFLSTPLQLVETMLLVHF